MEAPAAAGARYSPLPVRQSALLQLYLRGEDEQPNSNHSLPASLMRETDAVARTFFHLPLDEKLQNIDPEGGTFGYCSGAQEGYNLQGYRQESLQFPGEKDLRKAFLDRTMQSSRNELHDVMEDYFENVHKLAEELTGHVAVALGLPSTQFAENCRPSVVRFNYYPPCPNPASTLGLIPHSDAFVITVLQQDDVSGLQILKDGNWLTLRPQPDTLIINVGDTLQIWSNDILPSVIHRVVVNSERERLTAAFFFGPKPKTQNTDTTSLRSCNCRASSSEISTLHIRGVHRHCGKS